MPYKHIFDPKAAEEYEEAYNWYKERSYIAGDKLIIEVEEAVKKICANLYATAIRTKTCGRLHSENILIALSIYLTKEKRQ